MKLFFSMDPVCRSIYLSERSGKARVVAPVGWNTGVKSEKRVAAKGGERRSFCPLASHPTSFSLARCPVKSVTLWLPPVNEGTLSLSLSLFCGDPLLLTCPTHPRFPPPHVIQKTRCNSWARRCRVLYPDCLSTDFSPLALSLDLAHLLNFFHDNLQDDCNL